MFSIIQLAVFAGTTNKLLKMCKTEKKKLCVFGVFGIEHFKKKVIVVYSFQEKKHQLHVMTIKLKKTCITH